MHVFRLPRTISFYVHLDDPLNITIGLASAQGYVPLERGNGTIWLLEIVYCT